MNIRKTAVASAVLVAMLGITACSDSDSATDSGGGSFTPPAEAAPVGNAFSITLTDKNGAPLLTGADTTATVTLIGEGTKYLSQQTSSASAADLGPLIPINGVLDLLISEDISEETDDVEIKAVINITGFASTSTTILIDPKNPDQTSVAPIQMSEFGETVNDSEEAVVFVSDTKDVTDATLTEAVEITTQDKVSDSKDSVALAGGAAKISIPTGVQLQTSEGEPVSGGSVEVKMNYYSNEPNGSGDATASALDSFPGGFDVTSAAVEGSDETVEDFSFVSAGFVAVEIETDQGEQVKKFDTPITIEMKVPADTAWTVDEDQEDAINSEVPITEINNTLADIATRHADKTLLLPVWSYEESDGVWTKAENPAVVTLSTDDPEFYDAESNAFITTMEVSHLSYWNLDWVKTSRCEPRTQEIDIFFNDGTTENVVSFVPAIRASGFSGSRYFQAQRPEFLRIYNTPDIDLSFYLKIDGVDSIQEVAFDSGFTTEGVTGGVYSGSICGMTSIKLDKSADDFDLVTPTVNVQAVCAQDNTKVTPLPAYVRLSGSGYYSAQNLAAAETGSFPSFVGEKQLSVYSFVSGDYGTEFDTVTFNADQQSYTVNYSIQCEIEDPTGGTGASGDDNNDV